MSGGDFEGESEVKEREGDGEMRTRATRPWLRPVDSTTSLLWLGHAHSVQA